MIDNALCIQPLTSTAAVFPEKCDSSSSSVTCFTAGNCSKPEIPILNRNSHFKYKYLGQTYGQTVGDQTWRRCSRINKQRSNARKVAHLPLGPGSRSTHHLTGAYMLRTVDYLKVSLSQNESLYFRNL